MFDTATVGERFLRALDLCGDSEGIGELRTELLSSGSPEEAVRELVDDHLMRAVISGAVLGYSLEEMLLRAREQIVTHNPAAAAAFV